ncbi:MAG: hypothetical protein ACREJC_08290 [Tepidisphaeraceae bacterium]
MGDFIDPNSFLQTAADGTAEHPADKTATVWTKLIALANTMMGQETVSAAGAVDPDVYLTDLSVSGTKAYTLANGTYVGQRKAMECTVAAAIPAGTVTIATMSGSRTNVAYVFVTVGQRLELEWTAGGWRETALRPAGADEPAAASTVNPLVLIHVISINGTQDWIIPSGVVPGQLQSFIVAAAVNTPAGTISGLFYDNADGSADGIDLTIDAAADASLMMWNGVRWMPIGLVSATT